MEARMAKIETALDYMREALDDNKAQHEEIINKLNDFIDSSGDKFACKAVEERVKNLETANTDLKLFNAKVLGIAIGAGAILGFIVAKAWERIFGG
jgi:hypothetical protein